jgi:1,2-phenylacetyl-CoA epoxidase catalytic subunit
MSTMYRYALPVEVTQWTIGKQGETTFSWEYEDGRRELLDLYEKGKRLQWDAALRLDWSQDLDPENPQQIDDRAVPIYGTPLWEKLSDREKIKVRHHQQAHTLSQFMHGEQGALMVAAKLVHMVPNVEAKFYAATQTMDEARHVETYSRLLHEKFDIVYPITPGLKSLLENVLTDSRWDIAYLGMQVLIEGLALAAFQRIRDTAQNPLAAAVNAYVMQDEARHVAFGRIALRDYYPKLTEAERAEREEFVIEACYHMRDRFNQTELWANLGFEKEVSVKAVMGSELMAQFRGRLFSRIVPTVKDIGLWSPKVQAAFREMGAIQFADVDARAMLENDQRVAEEFDAKRHVAQALATPLGKPGAPSH